MKIKDFELIFFKKRMMRPFFCDWKVRFARAEFSRLHETCHLPFTQVRKVGGGGHSFLIWLTPLMHAI